LKRERSEAIMRSIEAIINRQLNRWNSIRHALAYPTDDRSGKAQEMAPERRSHPAICISRDLGSGARAIAGIICERLGYELLGTSIITEMARDLNVQRRLADSLDETIRGRLELFIDSCVAGREIDNKDYFKSLVRIVETFGIQGGVLFLGRGATFILREKAAISVLVTGAEEKRVRRVMRYKELSEKEARKVVRQSDRDRKQFIKTHFNAELYNPANYDLCINTDHLGAQDAADLIFMALERRGRPIDALRLPVAAG
jgi:cytidylate kinase